MGLSIKSCVLSVWLILCLLLLSSAMFFSPDNSKKLLSSDQAVHISSSLSLLHDKDLQYTLTDLERFRKLIPAEAGPFGLFLKTGELGKLYFAKPFLYPLFAAPFILVFGLNGFIVINAICFFAIGVVALLVLLPILGYAYSIIAVFALMIFSPFVTWIPIAHPDLFIAALLAVGGYLLLFPFKTNAIKYLGSFLLGMVLFEKLNFIFVLPFLLYPMIRSLRKREVLIIVFFIFIGWIIPTSINLLQDGNLLSYQGLRFYVAKNPFPLEKGWVPPDPNTSVTGHIFNIQLLISSIFGNLVLLPDKLIDFLIGRQTGILIYFPVAFALLVILILKANLKSYLIVAGFFIYLGIYWLVFPANGYGGSGSYGSRYLMQVLPIIILAFLFVKQSDFYKNGRIQMWIKLLILFSTILSVLLQNQVLPPTDKLVRVPSVFLNSSLAKTFPLETTLLTFIGQIMPKGFYTFSKNKMNIIYKTGFNYKNNYTLMAGQSADFVLYQVGPREHPPSLGLFATTPMRVDLIVDGHVVKMAEINAGFTDLLKFDVNIFDKSAFDTFFKYEHRWKKMTLKASSLTKTEKNMMGWVNIDFFSNLVVDLNYFKKFGLEIIPKNFKESEIKQDYGWSCIEDWGMWSDGEYSVLTVNIKDKHNPLLFKFNVQAYTSLKSKTQVIDVFVNGQKKDVWKFVYGMEPVQTHSLIVTKDERLDLTLIQICFKIHNPQSPFELGYSADNRRLGLGLRSLEIIKK